jgi:CRP-like cAMP-binding protein
VHATGVCSGGCRAKLSDLRQWLVTFLTPEDRIDRGAKPLPESPDFAPWLRETMTRADFDALPDNDIQALRPFGTRRTYPRGVTLFRQGDQPKEFFIIETGDFELVRDTRFERLVVQIVHAGSSIDAPAVTLDAPYSYSAVGLSDATVLCFRLDTIRTLEELFPEISLRWLRLLARTLDRAHQRLESAGRPAVEQVAQFLVHESDERAMATIDLTQNEVAEILGLSRQTVARVLHDLAREHVVERERRCIRILDPMKLRSRLPR